MTKEEAKKKLETFLGDTVLTFSIRQEEGENWVAQCNEIDGIITCGTGYDLKVMEELMQDAILSAAGIPAEFTDNLLKRVYGGNTEVMPLYKEQVVFQSHYVMNNSHVLA